MTELSSKGFVWSLVRPRQHEPDLAQAQFAAFSKQMPLLYLILLASAWSVAIIHLDNAPATLTIYVPLGLTIACLLRLVQWSRNGAAHPSNAEARRALRVTHWLAIILAAGFTGWALSLLPYSQGYDKFQIAFFLAVTVIGCVLCLMHLRGAALSVTAIIMTPFVAVFTASGEPVFIAMAINMTLVSAAAVIIVLINYRDFADLVAVRRGLEQRHVETAAISDEHSRLSKLDSLTELQNRRSFFASLEMQVADARASGDAQVMVGILDLDAFKPVNDTHGHGVGDALLVEVADRLRQLCGDAIQPFRLGGDEFGLLARKGMSEAAMMEHAARICAALRTPYAIADATLHVAGTMGIAAFPDMASSAQALYECADYALMHAKRNDLRGEANLFSLEHEGEIRWSGAVEHALRTSDLDTELSLAFQPIVNISANRPIGFEALARWNNPKLGYVAPSDFIPVAERAGMINRLTQILMRKALAAAVLWPDELRLSFNLSVHDISKPEGVLRIISTINDSGFSPDRIDFEITETVMMYDFSNIAISINALKALGVGISLDDFGTGYSSLTHMHQLPLDKIKIDRSFVTNIDSNHTSLKIVKSLIRLCKDMGLTCVVEGVESAAELAVLRRLGCEYIQGYYYAKPMREDGIAGYLHQVALDSEAARAANEPAQGASEPARSASQRR